MEPTPTSHPAPYIERFGLDLGLTEARSMAQLLGIAIAFIGVVVTISHHRISWPIVFVLFFAIACWGVPTLWLGGVRRIALRVDHQGVAFGVPPWPLGPHNQELPTVPWRDLRQIVLFENRTRQRYIGLALRPGAPPPPAAARPFSLRLGPFRSSAPQLPHVPPEVIQLSRPIHSWRLDYARLLEVVTAYAPDVEVVEVYANGWVQQ